MSLISGHVSFCLGIQLVEEMVLKLIRITMLALIFISVRVYAEMRTCILT